MAKSYEEIAEAIVEGSDELSMTSPILARRLKEDISAAIIGAVKEEREAIFAEYNLKTGDDLGFFVKRPEPR